MRWTRRFIGDAGFLYATLAALAVGEVGERASSRSR